MRSLCRYCPAGPSTRWPSSTGCWASSRPITSSRPNPYVAVKREDIQLHFFSMPNYKPEDSYSTCLVVVPDTGELFAAFFEGMRAVHGKLLVSGIPG